MRKLFVTDLDGTLLKNSKGEISESNRRAVKEWTESGHLFAIASGRNPKEILSVVKTLGLSDCYAIGSNGASVLDASGNVLLQHEMDKNVVTQIVQLARNYRAYRLVASFDTYYCENKNIMLRIIEWLHSAPSTSVDRLESVIQSDTPVAKMLFTGKSDGLLPLKDAIEAEFKAEVDCYFSVPTCLEIMPKAVHKGTGVEMLAHTLGIPLEHVYVVGDGENDIPMFNLRCTSFGMREGITNAISKADHVVVSVDEAIYCALTHEPTREEVVI
ncbi:MAG: HAD family hydrolase [Bacilli bacterium]